VTAILVPSGMPDKGQLSQRRPAFAHFKRPAIAAALAEALFLAAHDAEVFLLDQDLGAVEAAEGRAVNEQLAGANAELRRSGRP